MRQCFECKREILDNEIRLECDCDCGTVVCKECIDWR